MEDKVQNQRIELELINQQIDREWMEGKEGQIENIPADRVIMEFIDHRTADIMYLCLKINQIYQRGIDQQILQYMENNNVQLNTSKLEGYLESQEIYQQMGKDQQVMDQLKFNQGVVKIEEIWEYQDRCKKAELLLNQMQKEMTKVVMDEGKDGK